MVKDAKTKTGTGAPEAPENDKRPKRTRRTGPTRSKWPQAVAVQAALDSYFSGITGVVTFVNPIDGRILAEGQEAIVKELIELGKIDRNFRKILNRISAPGKYGPLLIALFPVVFGIAANHDLLPQFKIPGFPSMQEPELKIV